mgnify:CR=1 FL=1
MSDVSDKGKRVELAGALAGHYIRVDLDVFDCGVLEELESGRLGRIMPALAGVIVGGDLPHGHDLDGLRKLKPRQLGAVCDAMPGLFDIPKPA